MIIFVVFFELAFSFFVVVWISDGLRTKYLITNSVMTKIVALYSVWMLCCALFLSKSLLIFSVLIWLPCIFLIQSPFLFKKLRIEQFERELLTFFNAVILKIRSGADVKSAISYAKGQLTEFSQCKLEDILSILNDEQFNNDKIDALKVQVGSKVARAMISLRLAFQDTHKTTNRLVQTRDSLKLEKDFKEKAQQALRQIRAQMLILGALYLAIITFILSKYGLYKYGTYIFYSIALYTLGCIISLKIGKEIKWKV